MGSFVYLFSFHWKYKALYSQVVLTHAFNFHTQRLRQVVLWVYRDSAWATEWVSGQSRPQRKTLSLGEKDIIHNKRFPYGIFMHWCLYVLIYSPSSGPYHIWLFPFLQFPLPFSWYVYTMTSFLSPFLKIFPHLSWSPLVCCLHTDHFKSRFCMWEKTCDIFMSLVYFV